MKVQVIFLPDNFCSLGNLLYKCSWKIYLAVEDNEISQLMAMKMGMFSYWFENTRAFETKQGSTVTSKT